MAGALGTRILSAGLQALVLLWLARQMGATSFGAFALALVVGGLVGMVMGLGSSAQVLSIGTGTEANTRISALLTVRLFTSMIAAAVAAAAGFALSLSPGSIMLCSVWVASEQLLELVQSVLFGQRLEMRAGWVTVMRRLPVAAFLLGGEAMGWSFTISASIGTLGAMAVCLAALPRSVRRPRLQYRAVREAGHYWSSTILAGLQSLDLVVLGTVAGGSPALGFYAASARVASPLGMLAQSVAAILTPHLAGEADRDRQRLIYLRAVRALTAMGAGIAAISPIIALVAVNVLGDSYSGSTAFVIGAVVGMAINGVAQAPIALLYARGRARSLMRARLVTIPASLLLIAIAGSQEWQLVIALSPAIMQLLQLAGIGLTLRCDGERRNQSAAIWPTVRDELRRG